MILVLAPPVQCGERCDAMAATFEKVAAKASDVFNFGMLDVFDMLPGLFRKYTHVLPHPCWLLACN